MLKIHERSWLSYLPLVAVLLVYPYGVSFITQGFLSDALVVGVGVLTAILLYVQGYRDILTFRKPALKTVGKIVLGFVAKLVWAIFVYHFLTSTRNEEVLDSWNYTGVQLLFYNLYLVVYAPICEELVFRGYLMKSLSRLSDYYVDVLISAGLFSLGHVLLNGWVFNDFLVYLGSGLIYAILFKKSETIYPVVILHVMWNSLMLI